MNRFALKIGASLAAAAIALSLTACGATVAQNASTTSSTTTTTTVATANAATATTSVDTHFDDDDLTWDASDEVKVTLADGASTGGTGVTVQGNTVTITTGGVYRISGTLTNGQLVVAAEDDKTVTLILDSASITNSSGPAIAVTSADEVTVYLADGTTNTIADGSGYTVADDATPVAAIASASDLTIAGGGTLNVTGKTNDGVSSSDGVDVFFFFY
mgnify:FL=1